MSKYEPLSRFLNDQPSSVCTLSFEQIEELIDAALPSGARKSSGWWRNHQGRAQAHAWMSVGWKAIPTPRSIAPVVFERINIGRGGRKITSDKSKTTQVLVRKIDQHVVAALKQMAKSKGKSLEQELRDILTLAARPRGADLLAEMDRIRAMSPYSSVDSTDILREDRSR